MPISLSVATALAAGLFGLPSLRISGHHFAITTYVMCELFAHRSHQRRQVHRGCERARSTAHRNSARRQGWTDCRTPTCWSRASCSSACWPPIASPQFAVRSHPAIDPGRNEASFPDRSASTPTCTRSVAFMLSGLFAGVGGVTCRRIIFLGTSRRDLYGGGDQPLFRAYGDARRWPPHRIRASWRERSLLTFLPEVMRHRSDRLSRIAYGLARYCRCDVDPGWRDRGRGTRSYQWVMRNASAGRMPAQPTPRSAQVWRTQPAKPGWPRLRSPGGPCARPSAASLRLRGVDR